MTVTIFAYLNTIPTDPSKPIGPTNPPLRVFQDPPDPGLVGYDPWAFVQEAPGTVANAFYGRHDLMSRLITVTLHQAPTAQGRTPNRTQMRAIWHLVADAVHCVDEDVGYNRFFELLRVAEQGPVYDPETKGLFAFVRFRLLYFRP